MKKFKAQSIDVKQMSNIRGGIDITLDNLKINITKLKTEIIMKSICTIIVLFITFFMEHTVYGQNIQRDSIKTILEEAYCRDQAPRQIIDSLMKSGISDGNEYLPIIEQQKQADSINLSVVLPIIDMIYESNLYDLDSISYKACWTIIQHAPDAIMHKYEEFIKQLAKRNLISTNSYMSYIDRCKVRQAKAQIYGWQFKRLSNGMIIQYPILEGFKSAWRELGLEYKDSMLLSKDYNPKYMSSSCINETQFMILGAVYSNVSNHSIEDISITIDGKEVINSDTSGFFKIIISKQDLPLTIKFSTPYNSKKHRLKLNKEVDYVFLSCSFDKNMIEIKNE